MKLNQLLNDFKVVASGFPAFAGLAEFAKGENEVVLSTLSPNVLYDQGIKEYYAPVIPRNSKFETTQDIIDADLDVNKYDIYYVESDDINYMDNVIVSRHQGTVDYIKGRLIAKRVPVFDSVTADDIKDKCVIGTLPPHLVAECGAYVAITIKDFDYTKDGDLSGDELNERIVWHNPISVRKLNYTIVDRHNGRSIDVNFSSHRKVEAVYTKKTVLDWDDSLEKHVDKEIEVSDTTNTLLTGYKEGTEQVKYTYTVLRGKKYDKFVIYAHVGFYDGNSFPLLELSLKDVFISDYFTKYFELN